MTEAELKELYNVYWQEVPLGSGFNGYVRAGECLKTDLDFETVLDAGCGNGSAIAVFTKADKKVSGLEYSHYLFENLLKNKYSNVIEGDIANMPYQDNSFDLVFSSEVLEHLPEEKTERAIRELYRVAKRYFYGSISYTIDERKKYHLTLKPEEWWRALFEKVGFIPIKVEERLHIYKK